LRNRRRKRTKAPVLFILSILHFLATICSLYRAKGRLRKLLPIRKAEKIMKTKNAITNSGSNRFW